MFKKQKSITQANSTTMKSKITWAKKNYTATKDQILHNKFVLKLFMLLSKMFCFYKLF